MGEKIIFLDFDGVLNSDKWAKTRQGKYSMDDIRIHYPHYEIDPDAVERLNKIIRATNAKVVVSSTWRHGRTIEQLFQILKLHNFEGEIIDVTKDLGGKNGYTIPRGCEIEQWLESNDFRRINWSLSRQLQKKEKSKVENYIILDDDTDMLLNQKEHFINTSWMFGLTEEDVEESIKILNTPIEKLYFPDIDWNEYEKIDKK
jgi:hypothetical protein